jgi:hypothetical protein
MRIPVSTTAVPRVGENLVEKVGELPVAITDQIPDGGATRSYLT